MMTYPLLPFVLGWMLLTMAVLKIMDSLLSSPDGPVATPAQLDLLAALINPALTAPVTLCHDALTAALIAAAAADRPQVDIECYPGFSPYKAPQPSQSAATPTRHRRQLPPRAA